MSQAREEGELSFPQGARIEILNDSESWWLGSYKGEQGVFPSNFFLRVAA